MSATIDINVGTFTPLATGTICNATINSVTDPSGKVTPVTDTAGNITGAKVRKNSPPINFTFGTSGNFLPIGIAFRNTSNNGDAGTGEFQVTLTDGSNSARVLRVVDNNNDSRPDTNTYNFFILIQRTTDGALMLIDPTIVNVNEEA